MLPAIDATKFRKFVQTCQPHSRMPMGIVPSVVAAAFSILDERGIIDRNSNGYAEVAGFVEHVNLINGGKDWLNASDYSNDELRAIILHPFDDHDRIGIGFSTPLNISKIALGVLDIQDGESVVDLGSGIGSFMIETYNHANPGSFYGIEKDYDAAKVAALRALVLGANVEIETCDMFQHEGTYDKVISNYPFSRGPVSRSLGNNESPMMAIVPDNLKVHSAEWVFNLKIANSITENGIGVGFMPVGVLSNRMDEQIRAHIIRSGFLKAIVLLPAGVMAPYTGAAFALAIMGHGYKTVKLIDASDIGGRIHGHCKISAKDVSEIVSRVKGESEHAYDISIPELEDSHWNLHPSRYLKAISVEGGVPLSSLTTKITRGLGANLKDRLSDQVTPYRYLMIKKVEDGQIAKNLPYITDLDKREARYLVHEGDIVLGKMKPFKSAVAHVSESESIVAGANLYILRPDTSKVLPLYLKLFLESDLGLAQLEANMTGTTIPSVSAQAFDEILVPIPPLEDQAKIIDRCEELTKRAEMYERKAREVRDQIASLLNEDSDRQ